MKKSNFLSRHKKIGYIIGNYQLYLLLLPCLIALIMFHYVPMYGLWIAFTEYVPGIPIFQNEFVGFANFSIVFADPEFLLMIRNSLVISGLRLVFVFTSTIGLTLLINELCCLPFKRVFQTISYLPHFISWVIISGMAMTFLSTDSGILNQIIVAFGGEPISWYSDPGKWWGILTITSWWKIVGWGTIVYLSTLTTIDPQLYEAAQIDGANRWQQTCKITIPGLSSMISIQLILAVGKIFQDDFDQIYSLVGGIPALSSTTEVIATKIFTIVTAGGNYKLFGTSTAMGLFQGVISLILILISNFVAKKRGHEGIM